MGKAGWRAETMERRKIHGGPLTLEKYHRFFADPWGARITIDHLNHIISMHGFVKLHRQRKRKIMNHLVGQVDLQPPRRSTLHTKARLAAANVVAEQAAADVDAIGWTECPIGCVSVFAGFGEGPSEPLDHVLSMAVRRARSKRTHGSAYPRRAAPEKAKVKVKEKDMEAEGAIWQPPPSQWTASEKAKEEDMELEAEGGIWQPPPSPPPLWMRSPTPPPPPPSPPRPQTVAPSSPCWVQPKSEPILAPQPGYSSPPPPGFSSPPPPGFDSPRPSSSPPPPGFGSPTSPGWNRPTLAPLPTPPSGFVSPQPQCWNQPMLAPLPTPPTGFGSPEVTPPPPPQLSWGLPLPMVPQPSSPGAPPTFTYPLQPAAGPPPLWRPTVPPSYPASCWGAPSVLPPPQVPWRWPHPPPRWAPPHMLQQQRPPPPWGYMPPSAPPPEE